MLRHVFGMFWNPSVSFLNTSGSLLGTSGPNRDRKNFGIQILKVLKFGRRSCHSGRLRDHRQTIGNYSGRSGTLRHQFGIFFNHFARHLRKAFCEASGSFSHLERFLNTNFVQGRGSKLLKKRLGVKHTSQLVSEHSS